MLAINFSPFPVLETKRLLLREVAATDVKELFDLRSNDDVMRYVNRPRPKSEEDIVLLIQKIQAMVAGNEGINWAISLKNYPRLIGMIGFHRLIKEHYRAETGYMLLPAYHRMGYITEALGAVVAYGFHVLGFHSIEAVVTAGNVASGSLLQKNGFIREGYFRENEYRDGVFTDTEVYCKLHPGSVL